MAIVKKFLISSTNFDRRFLLCRTGPFCSTAERSEADDGLVIIVNNPFDAVNSYVLVWDRRSRSHPRIYQDHGGYRSRCATRGSKHYPDQTIDDRLKR
jgi:hypothetical protein